MKNEPLYEISLKELNALREFLVTLKEERDAIISFSLEGIVAQNNRKEEILKKIEFLENEKVRFLAGSEEQGFESDNKKWQGLKKDVEITVREVRTAMDRNMNLLSFSMDHVKSSIEKIVGFINGTTYGQRRRDLSFVISREV
jgi:biopolymer transport protein ExbB/TolQ